jgi:hypothetical protein
MRRIQSAASVLALGLFAAVPAHAETAAIDYTTKPSPTVDQPSTAPDTQSPVDKQANGKGFIFYPSTTDLSAFRFAIGAHYDAIDPAVMYGFNLRVPQLTLDARYGLGDGWSVKGHFNSMLVSTELLFGVGHTWVAGDWRVGFDASVGVYFGTMGALSSAVSGDARFGFNALFISPEYRPEIALGYDFGDIALSLRAALLLMGPERTKVGEVWAGLDNSNAFVGHSEMLYVENTTRSNSIWYFGLGAMTTRSYYALWVMFPDTPGLFTYPRVVAGYEF